MVNIATRVILRGQSATLDDLAAFVTEARHRGVSGDTAIQFRGATGLGAFASFSVDIPAAAPAAEESGGCPSSTSVMGAHLFCERPDGHDEAHSVTVDGQKIGWHDELSRP
ncbi:hypothetical protein BJD61_gp45 [Gordonia phage Obliviate]|uniref:hypothetical protein n=1 Tax=Gordonia phage Obliviate TaxID=1821559 RepID=UPI00078DC60B|nr:hypothetical protein BJD61_gp45 [Gordonia phage Obliviate]AMS03124.1 hypothetical protein SEA_OBLIVIATE_45 [Gordonia phage Obliviate]